MIEERLLPSGAVSQWVVRPDGRRVTVQLPRWNQDPAEVAAVAQAVTDTPRKPRSWNAR